MTNQPSRHNHLHRPSPNPSAANPSTASSPRPAGPAVPLDGDHVTVEQIVHASERLNKIEAYTTDVTLLSDDETDRALVTDRLLTAAMAHAGRLDLVRALDDLGGLSRVHRIQAIARYLDAGVPPRLIAVIVRAVALLEAEWQWYAACELAADQHLTLADAESAVAELEVDAQVRRMLSEADS